ncbi:hypothetical protein EDP2_3759 [Enterobacter cloacae S611]|uniref:Uncharacterized protein n=1 Tax=Enterobacter cloacae S611 TaxID=1399146 RepID=A0ABP2ZSM8_ENTCL|nr:hypothetical protein EDP2_3759 [Enterobacter cloacae S611]
MALRLSGLQNRAVGIAGWRFAYPAYKNSAVGIAGWRFAYPAYVTHLTVVQTLFVGPIRHRRHRATHR